MPVRRSTTRQPARQQPKSGGNGQQRKFKYTTRSREAAQRAATQTGGQYDSYIREEFEIFKPKPDTDHQLRIMPATWDEADNYGVEVFVHYGIGSDENSYLCRLKMLGEPCPICEEAMATDDDDYAKELKPSKRIAVWLIDRDQEDKGPLIWPMSYTTDKEIGKLQENKRTGEFYPVDCPYDGWDIELEREGTGLRTKYTVAISRSQTLLSDDETQLEEWMDFITENPIPDTLNYYEYDYIKQVFEGGAQHSEQESEPDQRPAGEEYESQPDDGEEYNEPDQEPEPEPEQPRRRVTGGAASKARDKLRQMQERRGRH